MERVFPRNKFSPLPKIGEGLGEWFETPSYGKKGLGDVEIPSCKEEITLQGSPCEIGGEVL